MKKNRPNSMQVALALLIFGADKPNEAIHLQPFNPHSTIPAYDPENEQERTEKDRDKRPHSLGRIQAVPGTRIPCRQLYEHRTSIPSHQRGHLLSFQEFFLDLFKML